MNILHKKVDLRKELEIRKSQTAQLLELLKKQGECTTNDLRRFGTGCSSRLNELRKEGHIIVASYERPGHYRYTYLGQKEDDGTNVMSVD